MLKRYIEHITLVVAFFITIILPYMLWENDWSKGTKSPTWWVILLLIWLWFIGALIFGDKTKTSSRNTVIDNRGATIQTQNNYAEKMTIKQTVTKPTKQMVMSQADKELLQEVYMKRGKYAEWKELEPRIKVDADADKVSDNIKDTYQHVKIDDSVVNDNSISSRQINPIHPATKPLTANDVLISRVIRDKVYDKRDEVMALQHESPNYIARKVFDITGGGSRLKYIAAIEQLIKNEIERENF